MENFVTFAIAAIALALLVRCVAAPVRLGCRLGLHAFSGFACLWLLNTASWWTGLYLPINAATVLLTGIFGLPGVALVALLEML